MRSQKYVIALAVLALTSLMPRSAFAIFQSFGRSTQTAIVSLLGGGTVQMTITLRNVSDNSTTTQIYWTTNTVTLPAGFVDADAYIQLDSTLTASGGGIQIYTDNTASDVPAGERFTYVGSTNSVNPAGLVDLTTTTKTLPLAWSIKDTTTTAPTAADPTSGTDPNASQWLFFKDRQTPTIV